jgi:hypothetical protein
MANEITTQFVREAEPIEAAKLDLMRAAAGLQMPTLPQYQVAGQQQLQKKATEIGAAGIGAYQPYLAAGAQSIGAGMGTTAEAADILRGADTRGQFGAAQAALDQASVPLQQMGNLAQQAGQGTSLIDQGVGGLYGAMEGYDPRMAQQFMNPYQQQVLDESMRQINRQGDISRQEMQAQAVRSGAFGGSREGIQRAEMERGLAGQRNAAITNTLAQGYGTAQQQAQQAFEAQQGRQGQASAQIANLAPMYGNIAAQQANILGQQSQLGQSLGQGIGALAGQQFGIGAQTAQGLGSLGSQIGNLGVQNAALGQTGQQMGITDVNFLYNLGTEQQRAEQAKLDAERATGMQTSLQPFQKLAFMSDIYKGAPSSSMAISQQAAPTPSPFQQIAGLATGAVGTAAAASRAGLL